MTMRVKTAPLLLKMVSVIAVTVILAGLGLLAWSMNTDAGWISIGVSAIVVLAGGLALSLWAAVWWVGTFLGQQHRRS